MLTILIAIVAVSVPPTVPDTTGAWSAPAARCAAMTARLRVSAPLRPLVAEMCRRAPTFRRQVMRLVREAGLDVTVWPAQFTAGGSTRARTAITRVDGQLRTALVEVPGSDRTQIVELVAHEFEHIVEQLDGVDLAAWAGRGGVTRIGGSTRGSPFETERARHIGRIVAAEFVAADAEITALRVR
jgi:hypothetical protein